MREYYRESIIPVNYVLFSSSCNERARAAREQYRTKQNLVILMSILR